MTPKQQRVLTIGLIVIGLLAVGFFGLRTFHAFREFRGHRPPPLLAPADIQQVETDADLIRDWMTIPYIATTYHLHPRLLFDAAGINPRGNEEKSLEQLNEEYYPQDNGIVIEKIKAAVSANQPPSSPTASPP